MGAMKRALLEADEFDAAHDVIGTAGETTYIVQAKSPRKPLSIAEAYETARRSLADYLITPARKEPAPQTEWQVSGRTPTWSEFERLTRDLAAIVTLPKPVAPAPEPAPEPAPAPEPSAIEKLVSLAKEVGFSEIYVAFRHRDSTRIDSDRLTDLIATAPSLEEAMQKLIRLAGYDETESQGLGLDQFGVGDFPLLCDRLQELTGDRYDISNYETPSEQD